MITQECEQCRYFSSAHTCMEKPTWGHCMWSVYNHNDSSLPEGRFVWANNTCVHFKARRSVSTAS